MIAFSVGSINIYWYGIFYVLAFGFSYLFFWYLAKKKVFIKYPKIHLLLDKYLDDLILYCVIGVLLGGRLGQVLIYDLSYYFDNPIEIFQFWKGGMSFIGGMVGVVLAMFVFAKRKKLKGYDLLFVFDLILTVTPFGIMLGRIGNFLNQELYGIIIHYDFRGLSNWIINLLQKLHIFHIYSDVDSFLRLNTNFISSFFEGFIIFVVVLLVFRNFIRRGVYKIGYISGLFLVLYSLFRFFIEYMRMDSQSEFILYLSKSQWFFVFFFVLGMYLIFKKKKNITIR